LGVLVLVLVLVSFECHDSGKKLQRVAVVVQDSKQKQASKHGIKKIERSSALVHYPQNFEEAKVVLVLRQINQSINLSINQSIYQSIIHSFSDNRIEAWHCHGKEVDDQSRQFVVRGCQKLKMVIVFFCARLVLRDSVTRRQ
jgi:hypothetical protein